MSGGFRHYLNYGNDTRNWLLQAMFERLIKVFQSQASVRLRRFMERSSVLIRTAQFAYWKGLDPVMHFWERTLHCKVHWRMGRRLGSCGLISVKPLIGSTIRELSISSVLWVLEVLFGLH